MTTRYPVPITPRGGSNGDIMRGLQSGRIGYPIAFRHYFEARVRFGKGDFTPAAATTQTIALNSLPGVLAFAGIPAEPVRRLSGAYAYVTTGITAPGIGSATIEVGHSLDTDALLTASPALVANQGLVLPTPAAAENDPAIETALEPVIRLVLDVNIDTVTAGDIMVYIPFEPIPIG